MLSEEIKARSGLRESPVIKEGDEKNGRSAYNEQFCKEETDLARKRSRVVTPGVSTIRKI